MKSDEYRGCQITKEGNHYRVTAPNGFSWTEDTVQDAKLEIDAFIADLEFSIDDKEE